MLSLLFCNIRDREHTEPEKWQWDKKKTSLWNQLVNVTRKLIENCLVSKCISFDSDVVCSGECSNDVWPFQPYRCYQLNFTKRKCILVRRLLQYIAPEVYKMWKHHVIGVKLKHDFCCDIHSIFGWFSQINWNKMNGIK